MGEAALSLAGAVPMGVSWRTDGETKAALNLEPDYEIDDDEDLVLLETRRGLRSGPIQTGRRPPLREEPREAELSRVLVLGWSDALDEIGARNSTPTSPAAAKCA